MARFRVKMIEKKYGKLFVVMGMFKAVVEIDFGVSSEEFQFGGDADLCHSTPGERRFGSGTIGQA